jgi:Tfp pilus assembly protein PilV
MKLIPRFILKHRSFSLVELITTIILVGITALPVALFINENIQGAFRSQDMISAVNLARFEMERVNNLPFDSIVNAALNRYENYNYDIVRTVTYAQGSNTTAEALKRVEVAVRRSGTDNILFSLVTFIARNINYAL